MSDAISQVDGPTGRVSAIYARVSSERQRQDETIQSQTVGLRELAAERGLLVSEELVFEAAIDAVRKFVDTVDQALPAHGEGPSKRQEIVDSAMEMADRLVHTQYGFIRKVIDSAGKSLRSTDGEK